MEAAAEAAAADVAKCEAKQVSLQAALDDAEAQYKKASEEKESAKTALAQAKKDLAEATKDLSSATDALTVLVEHRHAGYLCLDVTEGHW